MVTTSRVIWFAVTFCFALPIMALMFRDQENGRGSMVTAVILAIVMAVMVTLFFGRGRR